MFRYFIVVMYNGCFFFGWEKQPQKTTVRGEIEKSLNLIFKKKIKVKGVSRTDRGVHARFSIFEITIPVNLSEVKLRLLLQKYLPKSILLKKIRLINSHSLKLRASVIEKEYRYFVNCGRLNIFKLGYVFQYNKPFNVELTKKTAKLFIGRHDFRNFCSNKKDEFTTSEINDIIIKTSKNMIIFIFRARFFLRHQIRKILGAIFSCQEGKTTPSKVKQLLTFPEKKRDSFSPVFSGALYLWNIKHKKWK